MHFTRLNLIFISLLYFLIIGCRKVDPTSESHEYYIKYKVESNASPYVGVKINTSYKNEKNETVNQLTYTGNWEVIIGPVNKDFNSSLSVVKDGWKGEVENHLKIKLSIYVSKDNAPFALKQFDDSAIARAFASIIYIVD